MDTLDRAIIEILQRDGRISNQDLAARVGLTPAPCLRRVRRLEAEGIITGYRAVVDPAAMGLRLEVIIHANLETNTLENIEAFEARIAAMDEVIEFRRMYGRPDYIIRVRVRDTEAYESWLMNQLYADETVSGVDSRITMKLIKLTE
ncbi:Lrp/AsnC family transcriptional regulator [Brevibacterium daeguense]|uniref:Lrp/AsnC family transcriptional regulator n=1 Tax=Brevibacterium daeguense TaxID=909936 RepID=A0ABP8EIJ0_9MICO|nr:Lrp/AsnC family transcriptional regulator [Brevibacterium daeguense]